MSAFFLHRAPLAIGAILLATTVAGCAGAAEPADLALAGRAATAPGADVAAAPAAGGRWVAAGTIPEEVWARLVAPLPGGGALALAGDGLSAARWRSGARAWTVATPLNAERHDYAMVALKDGRVLVVGGVDTRDSEHWRSYSSAYAWDGSTAKGTWTKLALMGTARAAPAVAVLPDGRVLVAGGAYIDGAPWGSAPIRRDDRGDVLTAVSRTHGPTTGETRPPTDVAAPILGSALATAEILDPRTGRWSATGAMRFARAGAVATTLADGRVLVVGPGPGEVGSDSDSFGVKMDARAYGTAEVYDPATGRWSLVGSLPPIDRAAIAADGVKVPTTSPWMTDTGHMVALRDGGALLVGWATRWKHEADVVRTFRFDGRTGRWHQVGRAYADVNDWKAESWRTTGGFDTSGSFVGALPDGRVLVAGGYTSRKGTGDQAETRLARAFVPATNGWASLPSMPQARVGGVSTVLTDGSILCIGGADAGPIRFVPRR